MSNQTNRAETATRFWKVRNEPYADEVRLVDGWYWQDDECEEPMGPFASKAEAQADLFLCRGHRYECEGDTR